MKEKFIFIKDFLDKGTKKDNAIFIGKVEKKILIGPFTDREFDYDEFYKKLVSGSLYKKEMYKKVFTFKAKKIIKQNNLSSSDFKNKIFEYYRIGNMIINKVINVF